jgi:hypothetical protein
MSTAVEEEAAAAGSAVGVGACAGQATRAAGLAGPAAEEVAVHADAGVRAEGEVAARVASQADRDRAAGQTTGDQTGATRTGRARQSEALRAAADAAVLDEVAARQASRARVFGAAVGAADHESVAGAALSVFERVPVFAGAGRSR